MKKQLRELLEARRFEAIADLVERKRRLLGTLVSLTFDTELLIAWRAVEAIGLAADRLSAEDADYVRSHLRRLHWLIGEESGGICWYSPQAMAEIVRRRPTVFPEYAPIVATLLITMAEEDLAHFRAGVLWAIGRLGGIVEKDVSHTHDDAVCRRATHSKTPLAHFVAPQRLMQRKRM